MLGGVSAWLAPERLNPEDGSRHPPTFKSDIWSFSMVCIEVKSDFLPENASDIISAALHWS